MMTASREFHHQKVWLDGWIVAGWGGVVSEEGGEKGGVVGWGVNMRRQSISRGRGCGRGVGVEKCTLVAKLLITLHNKPWFVGPLAGWMNINSAEIRFHISWSRNEGVHFKRIEWRWKFVRFHSFCVWIRICSGLQKCQVTGAWLG